MGWGAFAGAAANAALNTYERLGEEELRDMQRKEMREKIAREVQERAIAADTFGKVGQETEFGQAIAGEGKTNNAQAKALSDQGRTGDPEFDRAMAESAAGALRENAARQGVASAEGPMGAIKGGVYDEQQAYKDYARRMAGVDSKAARAARVEGLQLKRAVRDSDIDDKFDAARNTLNDDLARINTLFESKGMSGLAAEAKKAGLPVKYVEGKNGFGVIQVLDPKSNKVVQTISNGQEAVAALEKQAMMKFQGSAVSLLGSADKVLSYMNQREELGFKGREVAVKEAIAPSEIAKNMGAASYYGTGGKGRTEGSKEKIRNVAEIFAAAEGRSEPNAEDMKRAAQAIIKDPNARPDDSGLAAAGIFRYEGKLYTIDPKTGKPVEVKMPGMSATDKALSAGGGDPFARPQPAAARPNIDPRRALPVDIDPISGSIVAP
jgi:hypothetical protein